ncbi:DUF4184 family protein [Streptomyces purpurogeneiscleroticus]|uniref:DUF4184 family protein n=1 Tax=Streptomyces purpurogeneiscleroticus TaxID=68259 RepID=UPI001CC0AB20|nr:DUF4184 family protein [Streptomyces purpurogeneiscleroticus]MBZ4020509.1 hypothetical protein [Streptomyces purpurogeneiscleroticus]
MPFTLSHAAAVLPAVRRNGTARGPLLVSALVAGSFAPDLTYYADTVVPGAMAHGEFTHAPAGVLTVDTLCAALLVGCWLLLRDPLLALLPAAWRGRVGALVRGSGRRGLSPGRFALRFWYSAVLGAFTHVVWDAFTHPGRWGVRLLPVLQEPVAGWPVYAYVQYGTSAVALVALGWFVCSALHRAPTGAVPEGLPALGNRARLLCCALLTPCVLLGAAHRVLRAHAVYGGAATWFDYVPTALFGAGAGLGVALPVWAAAVRLNDRRRRRRGAAAPAEEAAAGGR